MQSGDWPRFSVADLRVCSSLLPSLFCSLAAADGRRQLHKGLNLSVGWGVLSLLSTPACICFALVVVPNGSLGLPVVLLPG